MMIPIQTKQKESDVTRLLNYLMTGCKVDRVIAWRQLRIADLRSRVSNIEKRFSVVLQRETVPGKKYLRYWINPKLLKK